MKRYLIAVCFLSVCTLGYSQTKEIYVNPRFAEVARNHKLIAIMPFKAIVNLRPNQTKNMTPDQMQKMQQDEGLAVQSALESFFLKRKDQHDLTVDFIDVRTTNAMLAKHGVTQENIDQYTPQEIAGFIGVDAIINGILVTDKPMSEGASVALGLLVGYWGSTNSGNCSISINDGATGELLWKYNKTLSRSLGSDTNTVINTMMRKASRKLPYIQQ